MKSPRLIRVFALASLFAGGFSSLHAARQDGLVVYMNFDEEQKRDEDENSGPLRNLAEKSDVIAKKIGEGLEATLVPGRFGKAAEFKNGGNTGKRIDDWAINLGKLDEVYSGNFTVACWVKYSGPHKGVVVGNKPASSELAPGWAFLTQNGRNFHTAAVGETTLNFAAANKPQDGAWHHWAMVVSRDLGSLAFYFDGALVKEQKLAKTNSTFGDNRDTTVGASPDEKDGASKVAVDDLGIWSRALSKDEVKALGFGTGKKIPETSSYAWAGAAAVVGGLAWVRRRRRAKA